MQKLAASTKPPSEFNSEKYLTKYETIKEGEKRVNSKASNRLFVVEIDMVNDKTDPHFMPSIAQYDPGCRANNNSLIEYFEQFDKRYLDQYSFFNLMFFEFEDHPNYFFIIKSMIKKVSFHLVLFRDHLLTFLIQILDLRSTTNNPQVKLQCIILVDWKDLCSKLSQQQKFSNPTNSPSLEMEPEKNQHFAIQIKDIQGKQMIKADIYFDLSQSLVTLKSLNFNKGKLETNILQYSIKLKH